MSELSGGSKKPLPRSGGRTWARRLAVAFVALVAVGLIALIALVTQPVTVSSAKASRAPTGAPERLEATVRKLASTEPPRSARNLGALDATARWLQNELVASGRPVELQTYEVEGRSFTNVLSFVGPEQGRRWVVGAHYDVHGELPGADDNASGVAGLLELARRLSAEPPAARVDLAFYTLEEPPHYNTDGMGSLKHAMSLKQSGVDVYAMLSLEMIGYFSDQPDSQNFPFAFLKLLYPSQGNFIAIVSNLDHPGVVRRVKSAMLGASPLDVRSINAPSALRGIDFSDHRSFWRVGYPAAMITDTAFFRNDRYHTPRDTPDTLDYQKMAEVVEQVFAVVREPLP